MAVIEPSHLFVQKGELFDWNKRFQCLNSRVARMSLATGEQIPHAHLFENINRLVSRPGTFNTHD